MEISGYQLRVIIITIASIVLIGCSSANVLSPFAADPNCEAPCWYGLVPGSSTRDEAKAVIGKLEFGRDCQDDPFGRQHPMIRCEDNLSISFDQDGKVEVISFMPSKRVVLTEIIDYFGDPSHIVIDELEFPDARPTTNISLLYPSKGLSVVIEKSNWDYLIDPDDHASRFAYFSVSASDALTADSLTADWNGFGDYEDQLSK